ncbi:MAG: xanthine dehydrogenase family protein molybdopterin-binding subunit [Actinomycetota bacterium]|nr:xanthine dehydrogenase family protein molybdopterin-binding subunit [Actinomycetota bacterium]
MTTTEEKAERYVGGGLLRKEDPELITGQASYIDDITFPGMLWVGVIRSPIAHARLGAVEMAAARSMPGIVETYSGADLASEWASGLPCAWPVTEDIKMPTHWPVAQDKARYAGDAVAVVVGESRAQVKDAMDAVEVEYEPLDPVVTMEEALAEGAIKVHDDFDDNETFVWKLANGEVDQTFADAAVTIKERYYHPRLIPNAIEPRGVVVAPVAAQGEFTLYTATQIPHILRTTLAMTLNISENKLRVIAPDVGGGFGSKLNVYAEEAICLALARRLGRPVKWIEERSENYLATIHGRDVIQEMELAATQEGKITGVRVKLTADMGAYLQLVTPGIPILGAFLYGGVYDPQAYSFECVGVFTNKTPTDAYRGAGRPEATYAIERAVEALARKVDKDPVEIRRLNFIEPFDQPRAVAGGLEFDSGNYRAAFDKALDLADYDGLRSEQARRREQGDVKQLGVGLSTYIEMCGLAPSQVLGSLRYGAGGWETATIRCHPTGKVTVITGTSPHGQGHVTTWSQITADALGVSPDDVEVLHGDTAVSPMGMDTYGSRSLSVGGTALYHAAEKIRNKAKRVAAHELEVSEEDVEWSEGKFRVRGAPDKAKSIPEIALCLWTAHDLPAETEPGLEETYVFDPPNFTYPSGAHIAVVEVDTETGLVDLTKYVAVDDCGTQINPTIVQGQIHGGVAQGVAEGMFEEAIYDESGNLTTSHMGYYRVPSAAELPSFTLDSTVTPSTTNPLGVKGIGEAGTIAAPPAVVNAVLDALAPLGVTDIDMPTTPERVYNSIQSAKGANA